MNRIQEINKFLCDEFGFTKLDDETVHGTVYRVYFKVSIQKFSDKYHRIFLTDYKKCGMTLPDDAELWYQSGDITFFVQDMALVSRTQEVILEGKTSFEYDDIECQSYKYFTIVDGHARLHRTNGPALIWRKKKSYWINGHDLKTSKTQLKKLGIKVDQDGSWSRPIDEMIFLTHADKIIRSMS